VLEIYQAAVAGAAPGPATARAIDALQIDRSRRIWIFAIGKAANGMAAAAVTSLLRSLHSIVGGVVVTAEAEPSPYPTLVAMRGDHPVPGRNSFAAAAKIEEVARGRRGSDVVLVLLSGGASSLIAAPLRGMNEADLVSLYELLLGSGLDIVSMNAVRKRFSRWAAGRLALALAPAATHCLAISDVPDDNMAVIGSGPCVPDTTTVNDVLAILRHAKLYDRIPQTHRDYLTAVSRGALPETPPKSHPAFAHVSARVIGDNRGALEAAAHAARERHLDVDVVGARLAGEASSCGVAIAEQLVAARNGGHGDRCILWGGETTVTLGAHEGSPASGGRCQELALAAARVLAERAPNGDGAARITLLAAGTDGRDGATDSAGAIVDAGTWPAIADAGRDPARALTEHESHAALEAFNALIPRQQTGTNVNDVVVGLVRA
jgi:glycerate-2-kinase